MLIKEKNVFFLYIHRLINSEIFSITFIIISMYCMDISFQWNEYFVQIPLFRKFALIGHFKL